MKVINTIVIILVIIQYLNAQQNDIFSSFFGGLSRIFDPFGFGLFNFALPRQQTPQRSVVRDSAPPLAKIGRSIDGSNNNEDNPDFGKSGTPMPRLAPSSYANSNHGMINRGNPR